jgi:hypothetical protein
MGNSQETTIETQATVVDQLPCCEKGVDFWYVWKEGSKGFAFERDWDVRKREVKVDYKPSENLKNRAQKTGRFRRKTGSSVLDRVRLRCLLDIPVEISYSK